MVLAVVRCAGSDVSVEVLVTLRELIDGSAAVLATIRAPAEETARTGTVFCASEVAGEIMRNRNVEAREWFRMVAKLMLEIS